MKCEDYFYPRESAASEDENLNKSLHNWRIHAHVVFVIDFVATRAFDRFILLAGRLQGKRRFLQWIMLA